MAKEILIRNDRHNLVISNKWSIKSLLKHFVVLSFLVLATLSLFHIDINNVGEIIKAPEMAIETFAVYFIMYHLMKSTLRMINMSNQTMYFSIGASLITIGYAVFLYITFQNGFVSEWNDLWKVMWYYLPAIGLILAWKIAQIFFERKANPVLTKALIISAISSASWIGSLVYTYFMVTWYWLNPTKEFITHGPDVIVSVIVNLVLYALVLAIYFVSSTMATWFMYKHNMKSVLKTSINYAGAILLVVPFTIWFLYFSYEMQTNWQSFIYLAIYVVLALFAIFIAFFWKNALGSPLMISVAYMTIISVAWGLSMVATIIDPYSRDLNYLFTKACPLLVSVLIIVLIYFKNLQVPFVELLAWVMIITSMVYWIIKVGDLQGILQEVEKQKNNNILPADYQNADETIWWILLLVDGLAAAIPALILMINMFRWSRIQRSLKRNSTKVKHLKKKKVKVSKQKDSIKEAQHA